MNTARPTLRSTALRPVFSLLFVGVLLGCAERPAGPAWSAPNSNEIATIDGAERIAQWLGGIGTPANDHRRTELAWQRRDAQAPAVALVQGGTWALLASTLGGRNALLLMGGLVALSTLILVICFAYRRFGALPAFVSGVLLVLSPGFVGQVFACGPEPYLGLSLILLCGGVRAARDGRLGGLPAALALAFAVVVTPLGVLFIIPLYLDESLRRGPSEDRSAGLISLPPLPLYPVLGVALGVALLVALWPWLRVQTGSRLLEYMIAPHLAPHPPLLLFGRVFDQATGAAPPLWTAALFWLVRLPPLLLLLAVFGLVGPARTNDGTTGTRDLRLPLLLLATLFVVHSLSGSPWYDGVDGIVPLLPLLALGAAGGVARLRVLIERRWQRRPLVVPAGVVLIVACALVSRLMAGSVDAVYMNAFVGGPAGAAALGLQLKPALGLDPPVISALNEKLPARARVMLAPETATLHRLARRLTGEGVLREDLRFEEGEEVDYLVLLFDPARSLPDALRDVFDTRTPTSVVSHRGVPLAKIFLSED